MMQTNMSGVWGAPVEREMNRHQRGLVDTCFEEGQYEQGIASLDKLRLSHVKPSPAHIRQLVYIALFPPLPTPSLAEPTTGRSLKRSRSFMNSPSKIASTQRDKQTRAAINPTPAAATAAVRLLSNLVDCCSPASLMRALPGYPLADHELECINEAALPKEVGGLTVNESSREEDDSFISRASTAISECKDSWDLLRADIISAPSTLPSTTIANRSTRSTRRTRLSSGTHDEDSTECSDDEMNELICERAWPLLDWLIRIWEKEEKVMEKHGHGRWSPSLVSQIKPPRSGHGLRSEFDSPLTIADDCIKSTSLKQQRLGTRLLLLLINTCTFRKIAHSDLLSQSVARLQTLIISDSSPSSASTTLNTFLSSLPQVGPSLSFKICICDSLLNRHFPGLSASSRPTARRSRPVAAITSDKTDSRPSRSVPQASDSNKVMRLGPWTVPSNTRVLAVLESARCIGDKLNSIQGALLMHYLDAYRTYSVRNRGENETQAKDSEEDMKFMTTLRDVLNTMYEGWCTG